MTEQPDSGRIAQPTIGERATCDACGKEIVWVGYYWDHVGINKPRHIAFPLRLPVGPVQRDSEHIDWGSGEWRLTKPPHQIEAELEALAQRVAALEDESTERDTAERAVDRMIKILLDRITALEAWRQTMTGDGR